jgi:hypothetical protein
MKVFLSTIRTLINTLDLSEINKLGFHDLDLGHTSELSNLDLHSLLGLSGLVGSLWSDDLLSSESVCWFVLELIVLVFVDKSGT